MKKAQNGSALGEENKQQLGCKFSFQTTSHDDYSLSIILTLNQRIITNN